MTLSLRPHQEEAVAKLKNGSILYGDVGSGKTRTAAVYWHRNESSRSVVVITTAKKRDSGDWEEDFGKLKLFRGEFLQDIRERGAMVSGKDGESRSGIPNPSPNLIVDSWNNIGKYVDFAGHLFIFDEQRLVGTGAWVKAFYKIAAKNRWIMLSGTPGDIWLDYAPVFIANGHYRNITDFKRQHVVYATHTKFPKVERYIGVGRLVRLRNDILVHMPFERHTKRHSKVIPVDYDRDLYKRVIKERWNVFTDQPIKNTSELFFAMRKVANSDRARLNSLIDLLSEHPRVIVFYNFDYELEMLKETLGRIRIPVDTGYLTKNKKATSASLVEPSSETNSRSEGPKKTTNSTRTQVSSSIRSSESLPTQTRRSGESCVSTVVSDGNENSVCTAASLVDGSFPLYVLNTNGIPNEKSGNFRCNQEDSGGIGAEFGGSLTDLEDLQNLQACRDVVPIPVAEWNGHKHEEIPTDFRWVYLVQYVAGSEGWNCVTTDTTVMFSLTYSYKNWHQAHGRIDRLNTPYEDLYYYYFISDSPIDKAVMKALKDKKSFNERKFLANQGGQD